MEITGNSHWRNVHNDVEYFIEYVLMCTTKQG